MLPSRSKFSLLALSWAARVVFFPEHREVTTDLLPEGGSRDIGDRYTDPPKTGRMLLLGVALDMVVVFILRTLPDLLEAGAGLLLGVRGVLPYSISVSVCLLFFSCCMKQ